MDCPHFKDSAGGAFQNFCYTARPTMNLRQPLFACVAGFALYVSGCTSMSGPHGLGTRVLLIWKVSPAQKATAQARVNQYFTQVALRQKPRPRHRYVAVQTLDPNPAQRIGYLRSRAAAQAKADAEDSPLGPEWVDPSQLHCVMVFDVETHGSVGDVCYVVSTLPAEGEVDTFNAYGAEFVASSGSSTLPRPNSAPDPSMHP
jgi:hypothetical protein